MSLQFFITITKKSSYFPFLKYKKNTQRNNGAKRSLTQEKSKSIWKWVQDKKRKK